MHEQKPSICYETGLDEAFLVGTRAELAAFSQSILDAVNAKGSSEEYFGVNVTAVAGSLTEVMAEVVLDGVLVVESTRDRQQLMNRVLENNGDSPIDWDGRARQIDRRQQDAG